MITKFTATDPEVSALEIDHDHAMASAHDCVFMHYNAVPSADPDEFLPLDSFIEADPTLDASDIVGGLLKEFQRDGKILGLPIVIFPDVIRFETGIFSKANVPEPSNDWTIEQFVDRLEKLKASRLLLHNRSPFNPLRLPLRDNYFLPLIAAYGGLPLDYRTTPVVATFAVCITF